MLLTGNRKMRIRIQLPMLPLYLDSKDTAIEKVNMAPYFVYFIAF